MKYILSFFGLAYIAFGIVIIVHPQVGSKIIEALPWQQGDIFKPKLVPIEQKKARPSIVRILGIGCIVMGIFILTY